MSTPFQNRLVGTIIVAAVAIIVLPDLLDGNKKTFQDEFEKLMEDYKVNEVVIIERDQKGKLAGSATSFKLEAAIQLLNMPVSTISSATIKEQVKRNPIQADTEELGLKKFQMPAFKAAYAFHNQSIY
mgnify:CR=1 FL=1